MHVPSTEPKLQPPSLLLLALEGTRAVWEFGASLAALPILQSAPRGGNGRSVLIFPGLVATDLSTQPLRRYLQAQGYEPHAWGLGRNLGPRPGVLDACRERIRRLRRKSGRKVSLMAGASAASMRARWRRICRATCAASSRLARRSAVRRAPPMPGASTNLPAARRSTRSTARRSSGRRRCRRPRFSAAPMASLPGNAASSGRRGRLRTLRLRRVIGLGVHPAVLYAVADRLGQPEGAWQRFDRVSGLRGLFYKDPQRGTNPRTASGEGMGWAAAA